MKGTNWNSATGEYTRIVHAETQEKANKANLLRLKYNASVKDIAYILGLSESRIREYLREL